MHPRQGGYIGTRGARPWASEDDVSYPGAYVAGLYNRLRSELNGRGVEFESLVNVPNWLAVDLRCDDGPWLTEKKHEIVEHRINLDLAGGMLVRSCVVADGDGRRTRLLERRVVSMATPHLMGLELSVVPLDWSGRLELVAGIDANVDVDETLEERLLSHRHLELVDQSSMEPGNVWVRVRTVQSNVVVAVAARCRLTPGGAGDEWSDASRPGYPAAGFSLSMEAGQRVSLQKVVAVMTSRDRAISEPLLAAVQLLEGVAELADLVPGHRRVWGQLWDKARTTLTDGSDSAGAMTFHPFHLTQVASPHIEELDTGLARARPAWRGVSRPCLLGHPLPLSRAQLPVSLRGPSRPGLSATSPARGPPSGSCGRVSRRHVPVAERQRRTATRRRPLLFNPLSGRWIPDRSRHQRHVGLAVAYEAWQHWQVSGHLEFIWAPASSSWSRWRSSPPIRPIRGEEDRYASRG